MKVKSVRHLIQLAKDRKAVTWRGADPRDRRPAAFVAHMPAITAQSWIDHGLIVYKPKSKKP